LRNYLYKLGAIALVSISSFVPFASHAQVLTSNGYATIPNPISPNCTAPDVWTAYNGHYMCAAPTPQCQYGYASGPVLNSNGAWSYSCDGPPAPPAPPPPPGGGSKPTQDEKNACTAAYTSVFDEAPIYGANGMTGPYTGSGLNQFNNSVAAIAATGVYLSTAAPEVQTGDPGTPANSNDMFIFASGAYCWVQPGTTNVTGLAVLTWCSPNGGSTQCGGAGVGN